MGAASAYAAVLQVIRNDIDSLLRTHPDLFSFKEVDQGFVEIRDFQTAGVVAFAMGHPFSRVQAGVQIVNGRRVQVKKDYLKDCMDSLEKLVNSLL